MTTQPSSVVLVTTEDDARRCYPAFHALRPHLDEATFVRRWETQAADGYEIAYLLQAGAVTAAMGFRELTTMAWGRILYIDDLIALPEHRGQGLGTRLLRYAQDETVRRGCEQLHLDTGYGRHAAHRSYLRNGFDIVCHHMAWVPQLAPRA